MTTHTRLMLALTAIKLRCHGAQYELRADVLRICDDALLGLNVARSPEDMSATTRYDPVRVDGERGYEVEVRRSVTDSADAVEAQVEPLAKL